MAKTAFFKAILKFYTITIKTSDSCGALKLLVAFLWMAPGGTYFSILYPLFRAQVNHHTTNTPYTN